MHVLRVQPLEEWVLDAACRGHSHLFFSSDDSETRDERRRREDAAKGICGGCAVKVECLNEAIDSDERFGIWGGLTHRERRRAAIEARRADVRRGERRDEVYAQISDEDSPQDIAGPGRLARLPAVVVQGRQMSPD